MGVDAWRGVVVGGGAVVLALAVAMQACSGESSAPAPSAEAVPAPAQAPEPEGPVPTLVMVQSQFTQTDGGIEPGPAKGMLYTQVGGRWRAETLQDPDSNVWHKAMAWRGGLLTIGAQKAMLKHWTRDDAGVWSARTLWSPSFGGKFDRLRDLEIADLDGDGAEEMAIATHDMGVVAVGDEAEDGSWTFQELDRKPDTFVHEVEVGDVDGDGKPEFYVTPSARNKASGESQPGGVVRYDRQEDGSYASTTVVSYEGTHAKEILVTDLDGDGTDELYAVKEGEVTKQGKSTSLQSPVQIVRLVPAEGAYQEQVVATLEGEHQCRFLVAGDLDGDGVTDLVASGYKTGLWWIPGAGKAELPATPALVSKDSGGFEHATHVADLDGDGQLEIYAASEKRSFRLLRRFTWADGGWNVQVIAPIPERHITWNLQDAAL